MTHVTTNATLALIVEDDPATRAVEEIVLEADGRFCGAHSRRTAKRGSDWRANASLQSSCWTWLYRRHLASMF